jgi:hypothetical protein
MNADYSQFTINLKNDGRTALTLISIDTMLNNPILNAYYFLRVSHRIEESLSVNFLLDEL